MAPKEKAQWLLNKLIAEGGHEDGWHKLHKAANDYCDIKIVYEGASIYSDNNGNMIFGDEYWQQVKNEIEKI